jgi:AraC-like DNA-binding protein/mannose-6-phosphate isomerase-like protein (cupin superfamily)
MLASRRAQRELVPRDPSLPLTLRDIRSTHFSYPWHYHPEVELTYVVQGHGLRYVGDSIGEFEDGDLCLIGPETPHCWLSRPVTGKPVRAMCLQFPSDIFGERFLELPSVQPVAELLRVAERGLRVTGELRTKVEAELELLFKDSSRPIDRMVRLLSILSVMAESPDCVPLALSPGQRPQSRQQQRAARQVLSFIHENAARDLTQREVADMVGLSPAGFSRFFSRHFGKPFVAYVAEVRVGNACRLLLEGNRSIADIAEDVGFNNLANFNRRFRHLKGLTPSEYRRMARSYSRSAATG